MKKQIIIAVTLIFSSMAAFAQLDIKEVKSAMSQGIQPGYYVMIPDVDDNFVEKEWKNFIRDYRGKVKREEKNEYFTDDVEIKKIFTNPVDIYTKVEEMKDGTAVTLFFKTGEVFIDRTIEKDMSEQAARLTREFALQVMKEYAEEQVKEAEKNLKRLENDQEDLERQKAKLKDKIEDCKETINEAEKDLKKNEDDLKKKTSELEAQRKLVDQKKDKLKKIK